MDASCTTLLCHRYTITCLLHRRYASIKHATVNQRWHQTTLQNSHYATQHTRTYITPHTKNPHHTTRHTITHNTPHNTTPHHHVRLRSVLVSCSPHAYRLPTYCLPTTYRLPTDCLPTAYPEMVKSGLRTRYVPSTNHLLSTIIHLLRTVNNYRWH